MPRYRSVVSDEPLDDDDEIAAELRETRPEPDTVEALLRARVLGEALPHIGRFELRGVLGRGMGVVYDAWDPRLARRVALKIITALGDDDDRLFAEARALARLSHPNVVAV